LKLLFLRSLKAQLVLLITSMMFFTTGCEDDNHDHDHHTDAEGFVLENESGTEVYKEFEGAIITNNLTLGVGDTLELSVHFLDHDSDEIEHDDGEDEDELSVSGFNADVAIVSVEEHEETGSDHHEMALEIIGVSAGSTEFKLELMHGDHADYTSTNNIPVTVTSGN
jgi:activator of 2-hydroxyglutaryl-CoA dehydratase